MNGFLSVTDGTLLSLSASMALRQLNVFGVKADELESLRVRIQGEVEDAEDLLKSISRQEIDILRTIPEDEGEDRGQAEFVLMLSVYAEYGIRIACKVQRQRLAEAN
jgi:hypothetical protein